MKSDMSYNEIRRELKARGLSCRGKKVDLIKRLEDALAEEGGETETTPVPVVTSNTIPQTKTTQEVTTTNAASILLDPSVLFLGSCLIAPLGVEFMENNLTSDVVVEYVFHEIPLIAMSVLIVFLAFAHRKGAINLSCGERRVALWYLVNGIGFKSIMDTFSGSAQSWNLMTKQYNALESRYSLPLENAVSVPAHLTSLLELSVMTPMCFWVYYLIVREGNTAKRFAMEIVLATLQIVGTYYFYAPLVLTSAGDRARGFLISNDPLDFYLRGVFGSVLCPLLWVVLPTVRIYYCVVARRN